jgi:ribosome-associated protein YbcJ (S4-like RNA binding protein)
MRRDVRAIFIDGEQRTTRGQATPVRHGEIVQRDDENYQRDDEGEAA